MLAFTLIGPFGPDHLGRTAPASHSVARKEIRANGNRAIRPFAGPWRSSSTEDRAASQARRIAVMHVTLTVEVSAAASELLASRLVPKPAEGRKPCGLNDLGGPGCRSDGRSSPPAVKCRVSIDASR